MKIVAVASNDSVIIRAGRVFDGCAPLNGPIDITIKGGIIRELRPCLPGHPPETQAGVKVLDLREYTVLPGLVDCHVHLALDGRDFNASLALWPQKELLCQQINEDITRMSARGVMAVRDGGDREGIGLWFRNQAAGETMTGPSIVATGTALGKRGYYGSFLGPGLTGPEIGSAVENLARRGADQVKVLLSGVVSFKTYRKVGPLQFSEKELEEIVTTAHGLGMKVMAHASSDQAVRLALQAGVDSLEHGYFISRDSLEELAGSGIPWVPTLAPVAAQIRGPLQGRYSRQEREIILRTLQRQQEMVRLAGEMGVRIGAGSDAGAAGVEHGTGLLEEMLLLEESGLSRQEVLRAATAGGAAILGLARELGAIQAGHRACLIAVRGNPLEDLRCLEKIEFMILPHRG